MYKSLLLQYELNYKPFNIWNIDETGLPDIPREQKVVGVTGEAASQTVAGEKPVNTMLLMYVSAGGLAMPPMVIFKGSKLDADWREAAPSGYVIRASKTGYIESKLFAEYGEKFIQFTKEKKLDKNGKHLLLLDSHSSHSFNLYFMQYMKAHDVEVLCFPPHCMHLMQPLDDVPFKGLKKAYQREILDYNFHFSAKKLSKLEFFRVLILAYTKSMSEKAIKAGFETVAFTLLTPKPPNSSGLGLASSVINTLS